MRRTPIFLAKPICRVFPIFLAFAGQWVLAQSAPNNPAWWASHGVTNGNPPNDFAAANQGQAKNMAVSAVNELDNHLAQFGGAGPQLDQLARILSGTTPHTSDFSAVNLGMLKSLSQPFFDRLLSLGYNGPPLTSGTYPWTNSPTPPDDFAMANLGQLKYLFSFDVTHSSAGNGIPDWWVEKYFPTGTTFNGQIGVDPSAAVAWSGTQGRSGWNRNRSSSTIPVSMSLASAIWISSPQPLALTLASTALPT